MEMKDSSVARRLALMAGNGAIILFVAQRLLGGTAVDFEDAPRFYYAAALALAGITAGYLAMMFDRFEAAEWFEVLSALSFALVLVSWIYKGLS